MVTKGLNFENVTLVGVLSADTAINTVDVTLFWFPMDVRIHLPPCGS